MTLARISMSVILKTSCASNSLPTYLSLLIHSNSLLKLVYFQTVVENWVATQDVSS